MQVAHATKANELLDSLMEAIASNTVLSEFEQAYYKREAEKLPDAAHTHMVLTLLYTSLRQQKLTLVHAQEALRLSEPGELVSYANSIWAMNYVGAAKSLYDLISQFDLRLFPEIILENIVVASRFYNDYDLTKRVLSHLSESKYLEAESLNLGIKLHNLEFAQEHFGTTAQELLDVSILASEVIESLDVAVPVDSKTYILPESNHLSVVFEVECAPENAFDLNWELSCKIVEQGIDSSKIVARFDVEKSKPELVPGGAV
ncbi:hypothetical protein ABXV22_01765 [Vibrio rotiferianus]|uniref:hypothetical protein n=1 Tax=Vibrio rotiferianus TaxID=190895 RepID=UPI003398F182